MEFELKAYGKVNLGLDVLRRREDGYHEVRMIMQTVKVFDRLAFSELKEDTIRISSNLQYLPVNEDNLIYRACALMKEKYQIQTGVHIHLEKHIPVAAGMAGGSADAAASLIAMNKMFGLKVSQKTLMEYGLRLGADVPYCIMRGTALSEGIGEVLTKLPPMPDCYMVIAKPPFSISTKMVYENLHADQLTRHPDIDGMIDSLKRHDLYGITERMENVLETVTIKRYPDIAAIKEKMLQEGALNALMSGSGPTVFGIYTEEAQAKAAMQRLKEEKMIRQVFAAAPFHVG